MTGKPWLRLIDLVIFFKNIEWLGIQQFSKKNFAKEMNRFNLKKN